MPNLKVCDEIWLACALLHISEPWRPDFTEAEIYERLRIENVRGYVSTTVPSHVSFMSVANRSRSLGSTSMLYATRKGFRRLSRPEDSCDSSVKPGRTHPSDGDLPQKYQYVFDWYRKWITDTMVG